MSRLIIIGGERPVTAEYMGVGNASFSVDFGADSSARSIVCAIHLVAAQGANPSLVSASIGGSAATVFPGAGATESPGHPNTGDIGVYWIGGTPSGTSGTISATFSATASYEARVFRVMNLRSLTPVDVAATVVPSTQSPVTINADAQRRGVFLGAGIIMRASGTVLFSAGVTESYNSSADVFVGKTIGGFSLISADEANRALTVDKTGAPDMRGAIAALSLR